MRRWLVLFAFGLLGMLGTTDRASAQVINCGPYYTQAAFPGMSPPGYYMNLYQYNWYYPYYAHYNYSHGHYQNWWVNGGYATYGWPYSGHPGYPAYPIPGYVGGPQYGAPPYVPGTSPPSSHAGGPNGVWLQGQPGGALPVVGQPIEAPAPTTTPAEMAPAK